MRFWKHGGWWKGLLIALCLGALAVRLWGINDVGETWDEVAYYDAAKVYVYNLRDLDFNAEHWVINREHPALAKWLYGIVSIPAFREGVVDYTNGRILSAILGALTVLLTALIGRQLFGRRIGLVAGLILALMPLAIGLSRVYGLDSPTVFFFTLTVWLCLQASVRPHAHWWWFLTAASLGFAISTRISNLFLYPLLLSIVLWYRVPLWRKRTALHELWWLLGFLVIPAFIFIATWPWLWQDTVAHWQETLGHWSPIESWLFGERRQWDPTYFLIYILATLPALVTLLALLFCVRSIRSGGRSTWIVLTWIATTGLFAFFSLTQGGMRYFLSMMPAIALAAAAMLVTLSEWIRAKHALGGLVTIFGTYLLIHAVWNQPFQLDYYNEIVGGSRLASEQRSFQIGWWGEGVEGAVLWLNTLAAEGESVDFQAVPDRSQRLLRTDLVRKPFGTWIITNPNTSWNQVLTPAFFGYELRYQVMTRGASLAEVWRQAQ